jgi:hypothetical protein
MKQTNIFIIDESMREILRLIKEAENNGYIKYGKIQVNHGVYCQDMILKSEVH